jgi:hypothetical protein
MTRFSIGVFRVGAWLGAAFSCLNCAILLLDGLVHSERLGTQFLMVTTAAGLMFGLVGVAIVGLHWSLNRIYRHQTGRSESNVPGNLSVPWTVVHLVLGLLLVIAAALMAGASIAMTARLRQGFTIFG